MKLKPFDKPDQVEVRVEVYCVPSEVTGYGMVAKIRNRWYWIVRETANRLLEMWNKGELETPRYRVILVETQNALYRYERAPFAKRHMPVIPDTTAFWAHVNGMMVGGRWARWTSKHYKEL